MFRNCRKNKRKGKAYQHKCKSKRVRIHRLAVIDVHGNHWSQALSELDACIQDCYQQSGYSKNSGQWQKDFLGNGFC